LEGLSVSATLVTSVVLLFSDTNIISPKYITALFAAPELIPVINGVRVFHFLDFCVVFCRSLFVFFRLTIALSALLRFTDSDYPLWDLQTLFNEQVLLKD
jgi:hypothetical protein